MHYYNKCIVLWNATQVKIAEAKSQRFLPPLRERSKRNKIERLAQAKLSSSQRNKRSLRDR